MIFLGLLDSLSRKANCLEIDWQFIRIRKILINPSQLVQSGQIIALCKATSQSKF